MKVIGLTGGIATGKTTAAAILRELGARIVDADEIAREIVHPGQDAWRDIVECFGPGILREDKTINREKLRKIVFKDAEARKRLESITHPRIRRLAEAKIQKATDEGADIIIYVAPLFFENKIHLWIRPVVLVACDPETQKRRLRERDRLTDAEVERHLKAQMPLEQKRELADFIVENDGSVDDLKTKLRKLWEEIKST